MGKKRKEEKRKEESWIIIRRIGKRERIEGLKRVLAVLLLTVFRFLEIICISFISWSLVYNSGELQDP